MSQADTKNFFRQSGWMMASNLICGVFMAAAAFSVANLVTPLTDYSVFVTILRVFVILTLPAAGIQTLLAQQTAAALTDEARRDLAATARGVLKISIGFWLVLVLIAVLFPSKIVELLKATNPNIIWATLALLLFAFLFQFYTGILQGLQNFLMFGWATVLNGIGRFTLIFVGMKFFGFSAIGAVLGACAGFVAGIACGVGPARAVFRPAGGQFDWKSFAKKWLPLTAAAGSTQLIINMDMPLVQSHFEREVSMIYGGAETIGIAIVTLCVPVAAVMFPKLVKGRASASGSNALSLAVVGTALIGVAAALFCTFLPWLPLRILFHKNPEYMRAAPLIPWFMWAMVPLTMYNVLVNNLIAREKYSIAPWAAALPILYGITLNYFLNHQRLAPLLAFRGVIQILMVFSTLMFLLAAFYSSRAAGEDGGASRSRARGAKP